MNSPNMILNIIVQDNLDICSNIGAAKARMGELNTFPIQILRRISTSCIKYNTPPHIVNTSV